MGTSPAGDPATGGISRPAVILASLDEASEAALVTDPGGRLLAANSRAAGLAGSPAQALVGRHLTDLLGSPGAPGTAPALDDLRAPRRDAAWVLRRQDGTSLEVGLSSLPLSGGDLLWILRDLPGRVHPAADQWFGIQAIESSMNAIAFAGLDGRLSYVNPSFLRMWGYSAVGEVVGRSAVEFWDSPEQASTVLARVGSEGAWVGEMAGRRANGARFPVELSATMVRNGAGAAMGLMGFFLDVSERTRAMAALRASEERLRQAIRVTQIGIFDHDQVTDTIYWSPRQREHYGFGPGETVTLEAFIACVHPDDRARIGEAVQRAHRPGGDGLFDVDHRIIRRDGTERWLQTRSQTFFEGQGEACRPVRTVGAVLDITERLRADAERDRLQAQLGQAQKMESIGQLAGGVAHDFNNMLAVILGTVELVKGRQSRDPELASDLDDIERAALSARDVTRQLLAFSRRQVISPRPLQLNELLATTQKTMARLIGENVPLEFRPGPGLWPVLMDASQVEQIMMNLAANARDAMPEGGVLTVETSNARVDQAYCLQNPGFRPGDYVVLAISDTGVGMDAATRERIFEPFFTTKGFGRGTGLGLATVFGIVTQNAGMIHVYSEPGKGSTFRVYLPRFTAEGTAPESPQEAPATLRGTVLLVEDDEMVRRVTAGMLESLGLEVLAAATWREALAFVGRADAPIDLLLTDVVMPGMSGKVLSDRIAALRPGLPVVFMSGYTPDVVIHHGVLEQGLRLIQKPFSRGDLARAVQDALRRP
jgi:PAS domain S-box-containing protein